MKIYRYLLLILLTVIFTTTVTPVVAKIHFSLNPFVVSRVNVNVGDKLKQSDKLHEGKRLYDEGKLTQVAQIWEQALSIFKRKGELRNQVLSYNYLSVV